METLVRLWMACCIWRIPCIALTVIVISEIVSFPTAGPSAAWGLEVGTARVDITPITFPVLVNGGMLSQSVDKVKNPLMARAISLVDGDTQVVLVVVDSCMLPRAVLDDVKQRAAARCSIPPSHMLISATHTHSAPSAIACLGTDADPHYVPFLQDRLVDVIVRSTQARQPARAGWGTIRADDYTAVRHWIRRPDRMGEDPFGNLTVRANMHAAVNWDDVTGPAGPEDPWLTMIAWQTLSGAPIAVLANFSMHYYGDEPLSPDYFGLFCQELESQLGPSPRHEPTLPADSSAKENRSNGTEFLAIMSHGCSGDIWRRDYTLPVASRNEPTLEQYSVGLARLARDAYESIQYQDHLPLRMAEHRMTLSYRLPDKQRLEWAQRIVSGMGDRLPQTTQEVYAREQIYLHERQSAEVVVQAVRLGDMAIATTPCETYALSGMKIKSQSPSSRTMVIELANGAEGYIPPPEQHRLGGYNTWPARSAGLEVQAEPIIVESALELLEQVMEQPRRRDNVLAGPASQLIQSLKPFAYWTMNEWQSPWAIDASGNGHDATYESGVVFFLEGPTWGFAQPHETNRAPHFAGGRMRVRLPELANEYSISLWFWNGMPANARPIVGWMFSRGHDFGHPRAGEHCGLSSVGDQTRLVFIKGSESAEEIVGSSNIARWSWNHVIWVRDAEQLKVYLNGHREPELQVKLPHDAKTASDELFLGGRADGNSNWEGRLDEIALFNRALSDDEVHQLGRIGITP